METGPLAVWLFHGLTTLGVPIVCLHARQVHAALSVQLNKTDSNDAAGIAQLVRSGWYRPVEIKSLGSHELRLMFIARAGLECLLVRKPGAGRQISAQWLSLYNEQRPHRALASCLPASIGSAKQDRKILVSICPLDGEDYRASGAIW